jgi:hypothetical protein
MRDALMLGWLQTIRLRLYVEACKVVMLGFKVITVRRRACDGQLPHGTTARKAQIPSKSARLERVEASDTAYGYRGR